MFWQKVNDFLSFEIFSYEDVHITVFNLVIVVLILALARFLVWFLKIVLRKRLIRLGRFDEGRKFAILSIAKYFIYTLAILLGLEFTGVNITVLLAGSTALLVGLGLGLQKTFTDIVSGVVLLFEGTLEIGDVVEVDKVVGKVEEIGLRTSKIKTRDQVSMIIPNSKFVSDTVINWSHQQELTRFEVLVSVAYGTDITLVKKVLLGVSDNNKQVAKDPAPRVMFRDFGDSGLVFGLYFFSQFKFEAEFVKSDIRFGIDAAFKENGIRIPFPQRDLHIRSDLRGRDSEA